MDSNGDQSVAFHDFLGRMKHAASIDLVRSIKSFLVSFSFQGMDCEISSKKVQDFFVSMETAFMHHPLWANATDEDIDCALEGLEKYVMTKMFTKTFPLATEDVGIDQQIFDKIELLRTFLRCEHLDIPPVFHNEASLLLAEKELLKINSCIAPLDKLRCITNCCKVISNLMLNASNSKDYILSGADDFLPLLVYVIIKANPPHLHSNLKFIQLYRRRPKLVSGAAYYLTNFIAAETFISDLTAKSLSIGEKDFDNSMQAARLCREAIPANQTNEPRSYTAMDMLLDPCKLARTQTHAPLKKAETEYPYMDTEAGELTIGDVKTLLGLYKEVVTQYNSLCKAVGHNSFVGRLKKKE